MNLVCAYCGFAFAEDRVAMLRRDEAVRARLGGVVVVALAVCLCVAYLVILTR
jgi:hypothetical protein